MEKLVHLDKDEAKEIEEIFGITHYNHPPFNFREVDEEYIATKSWFRTYGFRYTWYAQIFIDEEKEKGLRNQPLLGMHFFGLGDGTGIAFYTDYWGKKVRWFAFGCEHSYCSVTQQEFDEHNKEVTAKFRAGEITQQQYHQQKWTMYRCWHIEKCTKCGNIWQYDSSD